MDNVGIVVESLDNAISFFTELGLKLMPMANTPFTPLCPVNYYEVKN
jgi:hypothetical protein